jgi:hypothetical protein
VSRPAGQRARYADAVRARIFDFLGPKCSLCGADLRTCAWEVNHIFKRDWHPRRVNRYDRQLRYWKEAQMHLVNLLCASCNSTYKPSPLPVPTALTTANDPF